MKFIVGRKLYMSQVFKDDGRVVPVTVVEAGPCVVTQVKTTKNDGYSAVQIGFGETKNNLKPQVGHLKGLPMVRESSEVRLSEEEAQALTRGNVITTKVFSEGDTIKVSGTSKGRGFQGVVKRHGFSGQGSTHGVKDQMRMPGSSGAQGPQHVFKGIRKPGHMGDAAVTVANLEVVKKDDEKNLLYIKGAVPGARNSLVVVFCDSALDLSLVSKIGEEKQEEVSSTPVASTTEQESTPVAEAQAEAAQA